LVLSGAAGHVVRPSFPARRSSDLLEQGMLVQSLNAISRRFQNVRGPAEHDPLAMVEIDPLRPLNNLLWGYVQDEPHRLSVVRRRSEEHTSELQSRENLVCRLLLEK